MITIIIFMLYWEMEKFKKVFLEVMKA